MTPTVSGTPTAFGCAAHKPIRQPALNLDASRPDAVHFGMLRSNKEHASMTSAVAQLESFLEPGKITDVNILDYGKAALTTDEGKTYVFKRADADHAYDDGLYALIGRETEKEGARDVRRAPRWHFWNQATDAVEIQRVRETRLVLGKQDNLLFQVGKIGSHSQNYAAVDLSACDDDLMNPANFGTGYIDYNGGKSAWYRNNADEVDLRAEKDDPQTEAAAELFRQLEEWVFTPERLDEKFPGVEVKL